MLHFRLLGPLEARNGEEPIALPSTQQRLLLAMLLVQANHTVHASLLIDELWGNRLPSDPGAALRTQISRLRRHLGDGASAVITDEVGYRLRVPEGSIDIHVFERFLADGRVEEALELWRGPALQEFADREFAVGVATRLDELRLGARERRAENTLALGRANDAVADLEALIAEHPERERAREFLMRALYRSGRHTDALTVFSDWRRALVERGVEPGPALVELERRILRHQFPGHGDAFPMSASSFVGRDDDLATIEATIVGARIVTLCGPGGVGKTRLSQEVARRVSHRYPDGVRFCDLSTFRRPGQVERAVAGALGQPDASPRGPNDLLEQLVAQLRGRRVLLVLDNCEHLLRPVARIVDRIVSHTDGVTVLATSRERLGISGEIVRRVAPLDAESATKLFIDRARAADPECVLDERDVQRVCARLDRLPLAIELGAACMNATTPLELLAALDDPREPLTAGSRTTARHASLGSMIDWSYRRLSPKEQDAFDRFGVFAGRVDADVVDAVCGASLGVVVRLVDRSLLSAYRAGMTQYAMLETLRDYARARLAERDELDATRHTHAAWAVDLAEEAAAHLSGPAEAEWAARVARHVDECRAAHEWLVGRDPEGALRLSAALYPWAFWRGRSEVFRMAEVAAATASTASPLWTEVVSAAAVGAWQRGDLAAAEAGARAAAGHRRAIEVQADVAFLRGDLTRARTLFLEAATLAEAADDRLHVVWDLGSAALALHYGGEAAGREPQHVLAIADDCGSPSARAFARFVIGEIEGDEHQLRTAIELAEQVGSDFLHNLAVVSLASAMARRGASGAAIEHYEFAIRTFRQVGAWSPLWVTLRTYSRVLADLGHEHEAAILHGAAHRPRTGPAPYGADSAMMHETADTLRQRLGHDVFDLSVSEGAALTDDEVVEYALKAAQQARTTGQTASDEQRRRPR